MAELRTSGYCGYINGPLIMLAGYLEEIVEVIVACCLYIFENTIMRLQLYITIMYVNSKQ